MGILKLTRHVYSINAKKREVRMDNYVFEFKIEGAGNVQKYIVFLASP